VELCVGMVDGGLTPSIGLMRAVRRAVAIPVMALIRPRPGDFCYTDDEFSVMLDDIDMCREIGVDGVVIGVLNADGTVDEKRTRLLATRAHPMSVTFHRAIDMTPDLSAAMETLIQLSIPRLLTSGGECDAIAGQSTITSLLKRSRGRISIMAGGGLNEQNTVAFVTATGVSEVHGSFRSQRWGEMSYRKGGVYMGGERRNIADETEFVLKEADGEKIKTVVQHLSSPATRMVRIGDIP